MIERLRIWLVKWLSPVGEMNDAELHTAKSELAGATGARYYGDGGTIHNTNHLNVETHCGTVVAVWYRCQRLPFNQSEADGYRATELERPTDLPAITGVEVIDPPSRSL